MFLPLGQIGLDQLSEPEKLEFIDYINGKLAEEDAGKVEPIKRGDVKTNSFFGPLGDAVNVISAISFVASAAKSKPARYFYNQAKAWMTTKGKDTSHMEQAGKMIEFMESNENDDKKDDADPKR